MGNFLGRFGAGGAGVGDRRYAKGVLRERLKSWSKSAKVHSEPRRFFRILNRTLLGCLSITLCLRKAEAPLDNNICERALKKATLHRKNSLFYKTDNGARTGDVFMSLIHTCDLNGADPFDYLTQLQRHAKEVRARPGQWLPWTYRRTIARPPPR